MYLETWKWNIVQNVIINGNFYILFSVKLYMQNQGTIELINWNFSHITTLSKIFKEDNYIYNSDDYLPNTYEQTHIEEWIYKIKTKSKNSKHFAIQKNNELVGGVSISFKTKEWNINAEISYFVSKEHRNKGIMTRAIAKAIEYVFETHPEVIRIIALTYESNKAAQKPLEKNNFELEATLKEFLSHDEKLVNCCIYTLKRS